MFGRPIHLMTVFGFRIRLDWSWFIIAFLLTWSLATGLFPNMAETEGLQPATYWIMGAAGTIGLFICVALHELGHALTARRFGVEMRGITLFIFGGIAEMADEPPTPKAEFWIAVGGPIVSVLLALLFWLATMAGAFFAPVEGALGYLAWINMVLVIFNMIPAFPLDGGRVLRSIVWRIKNDLFAATRVTSKIGGGFGYALMGLGVLSFFLGDPIGAIWAFILGMFLRGAAKASYQQLLTRRVLQGQPVGRFMDDHPPVVRIDTPVDEFVNDHVYKHNLKWFPAIENGNHIVGWVDAGAVKHMPRDEWSQHTVQEITQSTDNGDVIDSNEDALKALKRMSQENRRQLCVVDEGELVGVISLDRLMKRLSLELEMEGERDEPLPAATRE